MSNTFRHRVHGVLSVSIAALALAAPLLLLPRAAQAQTAAGTISGRVTDQSGLAVPGVAISLESPALQGVRATTTSANGDYTFQFVPPGTYTVTFEMSSFATTKQSLTVATTQVVPLDVTLQPAGVSEQVTVTARSEVLTNSSQVATNLSADLVATLPTARTLLSAINMAPGVHSTGPDEAVTISGAMSFENVIMLNGVQIQDNLRGAPLDLFIEDAIQETTVLTAGISAEYGRFTGGVVNAITKSGGNTFSGSFRTTLTNDNWRSVSPFGESKLDKTVPAYEFTFGGPILRDRTWFFGAGRLRNLEASDTTAITRIPFTTGDDEKRYEGKVTQALGRGQTMRVAYTKITEDITNDFFLSVMDLASLKNRRLPQDLLSVDYSGTIGTRFFVEGKYAARHFTFAGDGSQYTDLIRGTLLTDRQRGTRYWSPTFCGVCQDEKRDNADIFVKATYYLSTGLGAHTMVGGYDTFNDKIRADNHQSGSDYRILGTTSIVQADNTIYPVFAPGSTRIQWNPIDQNSLGTNFRTHSLFVNDNWRANSHLTLNLGLRWDKNDGKNGAGLKVASDSALSPRVGVVWDPRGDGRWGVTASYARYVAGINNGIADSSSPGGAPATFQYFYNGPAINTAPGAPLVSTADAIQQVFDWYFATQPDFFFADVPGVVTQIRGSLQSPKVIEFATGVSRQLGTRGTLRADYIHRDFRDFYTTRVDSSTGVVFDDVGQAFDLNLVENSNDESRRYDALQAAASYRVGARLTLGANYTLSRVHGTLDGETLNSGPVTGGTHYYPEYSEQRWTNPTGDLSTDQRHRFRAWETYLVPAPERLGTFTVGLLHQFESGTPYGAFDVIDTTHIVGALGYQQPPEDSTIYYFTPRDAFRAEPMYRTDLSLNYAHRVAGRSEVFVVLHLLNAFNQFAVIHPDDSIATASTDASLQAFDPFSSTPVEGVNWRRGDDFGKARNAVDYTVPRTFRVGVGFRF